jgi:tape measure domain-containing protein
MAKLSVKIEAMTKGLAGQLNNAKVAFKRFGGSIKNIALGVGAFGAGIIGAVVSIGKMGGKLQQTQIAMETFLGSSEKAKQLIGDLRQFADVTPFDTNSVIEAGRVLAGAGVEAEGVTDVVKMLGDISAGTGKDLGEMAQLYAKSMNKGKVQTKELLQLVNAGVPIIDKLAKSMNRPKEAIFKMAETGRIKFKDLQQVFKDMTSDGGIYAGLMEKQSRTLLGRWSTLQGKLQNMGADIGAKLLPSMESITATFIDWTEQAKKGRGVIGFIAKDLKAIADILETTREGENFLGVKGVGGFETNWMDTAKDALDKMYEKTGGAYNPANWVGMGVSKAFGAAGFGSEAKLEEYMKRSAEANERTSEALAKKGF